MSNFRDPSQTDHLTLDQIDDHLIGDLAPAPAAHLAACAVCAERVRSAASPIASFHQVSTAWSERRSATLPIPVPTAQRPVWHRHMAWATASLSLAFGVAFTNASHQFSLNTSSRATPAAAVAPQQAGASLTASIVPAPQPAQISADNHMLRAIDASLDAPSDSPADLGLSSAATIHNGPPTSIQD